MSETKSSSSPAANPLAARKPRVARTGTARSTMTRDDWVEAATQVLVDQGIDHVRVDVLAGKLGMTRGSFYWHFSDRDDLLREVLHRWRRLYITDLSRRLAISGAADPAVRLRDMISLPHRGRAAIKAAGIELAIRAWARRDAKVREALDEADESRLQVHADVFQMLGFSADEARQRAFLTYGYEVAESLMHHLGTDADRQARREFVERLLRQPVVDKP